MKAVIENRRDSSVHEVRTEPGLLGEQLAQLLHHRATIQVDVLREYCLDRNKPVEAEITAQVDVPHASSAEFLLQDVSFLEDFPRSEGVLQLRVILRAEDWPDLPVAHGCRESEC